MARLGGTILTTESAAEFSSAAKGETLEGAPRRTPSPPFCCTVARAGLSALGRDVGTRVLGWRPRCQKCTPPALPLAALVGPTAALLTSPHRRWSADTIRTVEGYADVVVLRHFQVGGAVLCWELGSRQARPWPCTHGW